MHIIYVITLDNIILYIYIYTQVVHFYIYFLGGFEAPNTGHPVAPGMGFPLAPFLALFPRASASAKRRSSKAASKVTGGPTPVQTLSWGQGYLATLFFLLKNGLGDWYTIYRLPEPVVNGLVSSPSISQQTNEKRTSVVLGERTLI